MKVGIVGAGIAGLACARALKRQGHEVSLFDKGKRPGGRLSTLVLDDLCWDFGAQYLKANDPDFAAQCGEWRKAGVLADWDRGPPGALVGVPSMARLVGHDAEVLDVRFGALVQRLDRVGEQWFLAGPDLREGPFDAVAIAVPAEQAAPLIGLHDMMLACEAAGVRSKPCWTAMVAFDAPIPSLPDWLRDRGGIAWASRDNAKPGRPERECWVIQAGTEWSMANLERPADQVAADLLALLAAEAGGSLPEATFLKAHRWRFALPFGRKGHHLWNADLQLGAAGDWCSGACIEDAWLAGSALARDMAGAVSAGHESQRQRQAAQS